MLQNVHTSSDIFKTAVNKDEDLVLQQKLLSIFRCGHIHYISLACKNVKTSIFMSFPSENFVNGSHSGPIKDSQVCLVGCINLKNRALNLRSC